MERARQVCYHKPDAIGAENVHNLQWVLNQAPSGYVMHSAQRSGFTRRWDFLPVVDIVQGEHSSHVAAFNAWVDRWIEATKANGYVVTETPITS